MPQAIPLILGAAVSSAGLTGFALIAANLAIAAISNSLLEGPRPPQEKASKTTSRTSVQFKSIVYGEAVLSGPILHIGPGPDRKGLSMVVALTGHPVEEVVSVFLGTDEFNFTNDVAPGSYRAGGAGWSEVTQVFGVNGQDPESDAALAFKNYGGFNRDNQATDTVDGIAYCAYMIEKDAEFWPSAPDMRARVKGKLIRDPQEMYTVQQAAGDPLTVVPAYSNNWAACVLDYLMDPVLGLGIPLEEIDLQYFDAAAALSDEQIQIPGTDPAEFTTRYTCNGVLSTGDTPITNVEALLTAGFGTLSYTQGKYRLYGGEYITPLSGTDDVITEDDLAGPIRIRASVPRSDRFSAVRGTFVDANTDYVDGSTRKGAFVQKDFPEVKNETYRAADSGSDSYADAALDGYVYRDINLPFTTNSIIAQRIANMVLNKARQALRIEVPMKAKALRYSVGDNVQVTFPSLTLGEQTNVGFVEASLGAPTVSAGVITSIPITNGGAGYNHPPEVTITSVGSGAGATAFSVLDQGTVVEIIIADGGTNYSISDSATLANPVGATVGWVDKVFKIETWSPQSDGTVNLTLHEDSPGIYTDYGAVEEDDSPDLGEGGAASDYTPRNLTLDSGTGGTSADGIWRTDITASFLPGLKPSTVDHYEVQIGSGNNFTIKIVDLTVAAAVEDPPASGFYTSTVDFTVESNIEEGVPYSLIPSAGSIGEFNFNTNVNTAALPEYVDARGNYQDFGEEAII